jgi:NAD(P)-dependent dehydrogenase (short-subunit alcohol dehydrogenase family)
VTDHLFSVQGKVIIITGASSGLGAHFAEMLASRGAITVLAARRVDRLAMLATKAAATIAVECDVTSNESCRQVLERALHEFGHVDVLVNNAGISKPARVADESIEAFREVVDVNLTGTFSMCRHVGTHMARRGQGSIVNIASVVGLVGLGRMPQASYAASKGAVVNLTRELAAQWARKGVRVNAIAPGFFPSEMTTGLFDNDRGIAWVENLTPMGRAAEPNEMDGALLYLASEASSYVTGVVLPVDGGWTAV